MLFVNYLMVQMNDEHAPVPFMVIEATPYVGHDRMYNWNNIGNSSELFCILSGDPCI